MYVEVTGKLITILRVHVCTVYAARNIFCNDCRKDSKNIQAVIKELVAALLPNDFNEVLCIHVRCTTFLLDAL